MNGPALLLGLAGAGLLLYAATRSVTVEAKVPPPQPTPPVPTPPVDPSLGALETGSYTVPRGDVYLKTAPGYQASHILIKELGTGQPTEKVAVAITHDPSLGYYKFGLTRPGTFSVELGQLTNGVLTPDRTWVLEVK